MRRIARWILLACIVLPLAACGSEKGHVITANYDLGVSVRPLVVGSGIDPSTLATVEILVDTYPIGEGKHCRVFLEDGQQIHSEDLGRIISTFDSAYPKLINAYSEDIEYVGMDKKIHIVLFDAGGAQGNAIIAGYFSYQLLTYGFFNNNKYIFLNTQVLYGNGPYRLGKPNPQFFDALVHEFQHLIHWSVTLDPARDSDTWLNEAMSEMAPTIAFGKGDWERVKYFTDNSVASQYSLTDWGGDLANYAVVHMWAQYMYDRFGPKVFHDILNQTSYTSGIDAVEKYLNAQSLTFDEVFEDWSMALIYGNNTGPIRTSNPAWRYKSIDTWAGNQGGVKREGMFAVGRNQWDVVPPFEPYSVKVFVYHPASYPFFTGIDWLSAPGLTAGVHDYFTSSPDYFYYYDFVTPGYHDFGDKSYVAMRNLTTSGIASSPITLY